MAAATLPRDIPPMWLLGGIVAMVALHVAAPIAVWLPRPWNHLGWILLALALAVMLSSLRRFRRAGTGVRPFSEVSRLVVEGAYRRTRNPMYLGLVGVTLGVAICLGTISPLVVPPLLFVVLDRRFVRREEEFLRRSVGTAYEDYCRRVRRWL